MRIASRLVLAPLIAASLVACSDDSLPTSVRPAPREISADRGFGIITIPPTLFVSITAGDDFTCASQFGGNVFCWGKTDLYQTGSYSSTPCFSQAGNAPCILAPTLVRNPSTGAPLIANRIDAGGSHACLIERTALGVWCWGGGTVGQLGLNTSTTRELARQVPGLTGATLLGAGTTSTCAQHSGGVSCWGTLVRGHDLTSFLPAYTPAPVLWTGYNQFVDLSVGESHACGIEAAGSFRQVDCWGRNDRGQAGRGPEPLLRMFPMPASFGTAVNRVVTQDNTTCVEQVNTLVQCTGDNFQQQFGNGTFTGSTSPQTMFTSSNFPLRGISLGPTHGCGIDPNGFAWCWGNGQSGQVGNSFTNAGTPRQVQSNGRTFRAIAAGRRHTCAIGNDNLLYCWGNNSVGQLGAWTFGTATPQATMAPGS